MSPDEAQKHPTATFRDTWPRSRTPAAWTLQDLLESLLLEDEIARIEAGEVIVLDRSAVRDRYQQFAAMARELLAGFRQVEESFRILDRRLREKVAGWQGSKGDLLDDVLGSRESITGSGQGRVVPGVLRLPAEPRPTAGR